MRARRLNSPASALLALLALALTPMAASSQLGGSLAFESDYRFRGVSLSNERPDLRLTLAYDHASGAYLGTSVTRVEFRPDQPGLALQAYAGYAGEIVPAWRWEAGAIKTHLSKGSYYDYAEAYLGLLAERGSLRLYLAPDYFGTDARTAYLEFGWGWPLTPELRLFVQGGALHKFGASGNRLDARLGAAWQTGELDWQLAWSVAQRRAPFGVPSSQRSSLLWLGTRWSF